MFYRLRQAFHYARFRYGTGICSSPPLACNPDASCTIHTVLSKKDLPLYLAAIKSFLRFYSDVAVLTYSDGSLDAHDEKQLRDHIPGARVVSTSDADTRAEGELGAKSFLYDCRTWDASYRRLIDTELWSCTPKRIIMDSDILVLRHPQAVVEWIEAGAGPFLMGQPPGEPSSANSNHIQTLFVAKLAALSSRLGLATSFLDGTTGGFYGCDGEQMSLERIEHIVKACLELDIPMWQWGGEQCMVIYLLSTAGAARLPTESYFNLAPDQLDKVHEATLIHFLGYCRFLKGHYVRLASAMVRSLKETCPINSLV